MGSHCLGRGVVVLLLYADVCIFVVVFCEFRLVLICPFGIVLVLPARCSCLVVVVEIVLAVLGVVVGLVGSCWGFAFPV